jgi:hypothetical protein
MVQKLFSLIGLDKQVKRVPVANFGVLWQMSPQSKANGGNHKKQYCKYLNSQVIFSSGKVMVSVLCCVALVYLSLYLAKEQGRSRSSLKVLKTPANALKIRLL